MIRPEETTTLSHKVHAPDANETPLETAYSVDGDVLTVHDVEGPAPTLQRVYDALDRVWCRHDARVLRMPRDLAVELPLIHTHWWLENEYLEITRPAFYQVREAWLTPALWPVMPETDVVSDCPGGRHPLRPRVPQGVLYRKHLYATGELFTLRRAEMELDAERFHRWQNAPHVAKAWEEDGPRSRTDAYLRKRLEDPHAMPLIGLIDGEPFAYIETYWAREDRIGPYYDVDDHDLGFHALVGETRYLGNPRTLAWFRGVVQFLFLLDPRTRRVVGEPAAHNGAVIHVAEAAGFHRVKDFDFPHKRAALMLCDRRSFFQEQRP